MKRPWLLLGAALFLLGFAGLELSASPAEIPSILAGAFPEMRLLSYRSGHFTPKGETEYVVFFNESDDKNSTFADTIDKVIVVGIKNKTIKYSHECITATLPYPKWALDCIKNPRLNFGKWDGYCYVSDFNENGFDEILFFSLTGMSFEPFIFEYSNDRMAVVLSPPPLTWNIILRMETFIDDGEKYIKIWGESETITSKPSWFIFVWDSMRNMYAIIATGKDTGL